MTRGLWSREVIGWLVVFALLPVAAVVVAEQSGPGLGRMAAAFVAAAFWQGFFRVWHRVPLSPTPAVLAVGFAVLAPAGLSPVQIGIGASFGIVLAELVFGGWGRNVIAAPVVGLALLYLSWPGGAPPPAEATMVLAAGASGLILILAGILPALVPVAAVAGGALTGLALDLPLEPMLLAGGAGFGLVFLLADPAVAPTTRLGRLLYGLLGGALAVLIAGTGGLAGAGHAVVFAILLAQIFGPALDHAGLALIRYQRERRHV